MNADDPQLTAYALDELPEPERSAIARAVAESPELQRLVEETRELAASLRAEFHEDIACSCRPVGDTGMRPHLLGERTIPTDSRWGSLAVAAVLAICALVAAVLISGKSGDGRRQQHSTIVMEVDTLAPAIASSGDEFVSAEAAPVSTFPLVVNSSSWTAVQQLLQAGKRPPRDAVHVEALVNAFTYDYAQPEAEKAFAIHLEAASCPWAPEHQLVRIGIQAREGEQEIVATNATVRVQFSPERIAKYRLLGYEARGAGEHSTTGDEIRSGHQVTALYEVVPVNSPSAYAAVVAVQLQYQPAGRGVFAYAQEALLQPPFTTPSAEFRFAAAVAEFALALRGEAGATLNRAVSEGEAAARDQPERLHFVQIARRALAMPAIPYSPAADRGG